MTQLVCLNGYVFATHTDDQVVDLSGYPSGAKVIPYAGNVGALPKFGPIDKGEPDTRHHVVPTLSSRDELKAYAASLRFYRETGGTTFMGKRVSTTRESQTLVDSLYTSSQVLARDKFSFKTARVSDKEGPSSLELSKEQVRDLYTAVHSHVQDCRDAEARVASDLDSGRPVTMSSVEAAFESLGK